MKTAVLFNKIIGSDQELQASGSQPPIPPRTTVAVASFDENPDPHKGEVILIKNRQFAEWRTIR